MSESTKVTISDRADAVTALNREMASLEAEQLQLAAQMNVLMLKQLELSRKSKAVSEALEKVMKMPG